MSALTKNWDTSGVRRPVSKDTPDRTDTSDRMSGVRNMSGTDKPDKPDTNFYQENFLTDG